MLEFYLFLSAPSPLSSQDYQQRRYQVSKRPCGRAWVEIGGTSSTANTLTTNNTRLRSAAPLGIHQGLDAPQQVEDPQHTYRDVTSPAQQTKSYVPFSLVDGGSSSSATYRSLGFSLPSSQIHSHDSPVGDSSGAGRERVLFKASLGLLQISPPYLRKAGPYPGPTWGCSRLPTSHYSILPYFRLPTHSLSRMS